MNELECVAGGSLTWVGVAVGVAVVAVVVGVVVYNYPRPPRTGVPGPSANPGGTPPPPPADGSTIKPMIPIIE
jgi:hypothetical protein